MLTQSMEWLKYKLCNQGHDAKTETIAQVVTVIIYLSFFHNQKLNYIYIHIKHVE